MTGSLTKQLQVSRAPAARRVVQACVAAGRRFNRWVVAAALLLAAIAVSPPAGAQDADGPAEPVTLVAFGDSLTAGFGLPGPDGFAPQLEAWLNANGAGPVAVVNAGVSGDTTSGGLSRLDWSIGADADAVLLALGANDMLRGVDPAIARENLDAMLARLGERGLPVLLAGMRSLANWGVEYQEDFEAIYPDLAAKHDRPLYPFFLEGVAGDAALNQADRIHPNADGVAELVRRIGPSVAALVEEARAEP